MKGKRFIGHDLQHPGLFVKRIEWDIKSVPANQTIFDIECDCGYKGKAERKGDILACPKCKYAGKLPVSETKIESQPELKSARKRKKAKGF